MPYPQQGGPQGEGLIPDLARSLRFVGWAAQIWCKPVEAWLRRPGTVGSRYFDFRALLGMVWPPLFLAIVTSYGVFDRQGVFVLVWLLTFLVFGLHRLRGWQERRRNQQCHSRYTGMSWLPGPDEVTTKCYLEPALVAVVAVAVHDISSPLSLYLLGAAVSLVIDTWYQTQVDAAAVQDLVDARLEQVWLAGQLRREEE